MNSMLNPLIYSRFSRDFRRAFKQILTCQTASEERSTKRAMNASLNIVLAQIVSAAGGSSQTPSQPPQPSPATQQKIVTPTVRYLHPQAKQQEMLIENIDTSICSGHSALYTGGAIKPTLI